MHAANTMTQAVRLSFVGGLVLATSGYMSEEVDKYITDTVRTVAAFAFPSCSAAPLFIPRVISKYTAHRDK